MGKIEINVITHSAVLGLISVKFLKRELLNRQKFTAITYPWAVTVDVQPKA